MNLRRVDVSHLQPETLADQPAPQLQWINISQLVVDDRYQRGLSRANWAAIKKIAADFRWSRFAPVLVAPLPGGDFAIIDGQHRAHAALLCGIEVIPCMSVPMTQAEQAQAFSFINGNVIRITPHHVYKAALAAGETWAERCCIAVGKAGCTLMVSNSSTADKKPGEVYCIGLIKALVLAGKSEAVTKGLTALMEYGPDRPALFSDYLLSPWLRAIATDDAHLSADLVGVLRAHEPFRVLAAIDRDFQMNPGKTGKVTACRDAFAKLIRHAQRQAPEAAA